jgi:murein L,D-transpeptidase YcbB/YkuD
LKAPVRGIAYGDPALVPLVPSAERVLDAAARAPSLAAHVEAVAAVNPIYSGLREAAWKQSARRARLGLRPAADRRLAANLERARALPSSGRYIVVNAATAILTMYQDGVAEDSMKVVVGKPDTPTPMLAGTIHYVTFNPYWNIPADVARRNIVPFVLKYGTVVLREMRYEVVSDFSDRAEVLNPGMVDWRAVAAGKRDVFIRQLPGPGNSMGAIKFGFANELGIYLHDTPKKELFAEAKRNFSLGCVRVEDARRLARWFLGSEPAVATDEPEQYVHLARGVPVYLTYLTAATEGDRLTFTEDVYGHDKARHGLAEVKVATASAR